MREDILEKVGLTEAESRVYIAMLKVGKSTIGNILDESGVSNSKIYSILDRLNKKGLVGKVTINNRRNFEAKNPSRIRELIQAKKDEISEVERIVPELENLQNYSEPAPEAEILEGLNGIKTFNETLLQDLHKGDTFYILGAPKESNEFLGPYFRDWHTRRVQKGISCKAIYTRDAERIAKQREKMPLTETRVLPADVTTVANVVMGVGYVATALFGKRSLIMVIKNKEIYESYVSLFNVLWKHSRTP